MAFARKYAGKNIGEKGPFFNSSFSTAFACIHTKVSERLSESTNF